MLDTIEQGISAGQNATLVQGACRLAGTKGMYNGVVDG
jgi:hypothetical protein